MGATQKSGCSRLGLALRRLGRRGGRELSSFSGRRGSIGVAEWLRRTKATLAFDGVPREEWAALCDTYLEGHAGELWDREKRSHPTWGDLPPWDAFETALRGRFGTPDKHAAMLRQLLGGGLRMRGSLGDYIRQFEDAAAMAGAALTLKSASRSSAWASRALGCTRRAG